MRKTRVASIFILVLLDSMLIKLSFALGGMYNCQECGKIFSSKSSQNRHNRDQHQQQYQNEVCPLCNKEFKNKNSLSNHNALYHKKNVNAPIQQ